MKPSHPLHLSSLTRSVHPFPQGIWSQFLHLLHHLFRRLGKLPCHRRGEIEHLHTFGFQPDAAQHFLHVRHPAFGIEITFQVMTIAGQSTCHHDAVGTVLDCAQYRKHIHTTRARYLNDLDRRRVLHPQPAGQIGGGVGTVLAAVGDDVELGDLPAGDAIHSPYPLLQ